MLNGFCSVQKVQLISGKVDLHRLMGKWPVYLAISFLNGRHILMSLVDTQTFSPDWKVLLASHCPLKLVVSCVPDLFTLLEAKVDRWDI